MRSLARRLHRSLDMPAIQHLLQRLGFVKLDRFGLELTAEGRILSKRPTVLDDGGGTPVVGWQDGDFAVSELRTWQPIVKSLTLPAAPRTRAAMIPPVISATSEAPAAPSARVMAVAVAGEPVVDEDDWEWTIALARARASGEATQPVPRTRVASSRTRPIAVVAMKDPASSSEWPKTAPIGAIDYDSRPVVAIPPAAARPRPPTASPAPAHMAPAARPPTPPSPRPPSAPIALTQPVSRRAAPRPPTAPAARTKVTQAIAHVATPSTIIPVPTLPTVQGTAQASRLEPVVRSAQADGPRRFPKGTAQVGPSTSLGMIAVTDAMTEDTIPNLSIEPHRHSAALTTGDEPRSSVGDRTRPGIAMPAAARAVELPSVKRRALRR